MTLIGKISEKMHGGSKNADETTTAAPGHGEASTFGGSNSNLDTTAGTTGSSTYGNEGTTGESMLRQNNSTTGTGSTSEYGVDGQRKKGLGEKAKEAVGLDPKDGRDPKDIGYGNNNNSSVDRETTRLGETSLGDSDRHLGSNHHHDKRSVQTAAPVVQERVHDQYENIDKTRVEELHDRTEVQQTVQPLYDERTEATQRERKDHGLEVHEHGKSGLDTRTEAELAAKREQLASEHRSSHDETTTERSLRPDVDVQSRTTLVEEVVPVLERDIYRPHEIEHNKRVVNIHHEAPELAGTRVEQPISVSEWESKSGHSIRGAAATSGSSGLTGGRRERTGSSSSSSSDDEDRYETVDGVRRKKGLGEKLKEKVGLDKKDGHGDPKDAAFNNYQSSSTTGTGYGTGSSSSYGTSGSNTEYGVDGQRKKGLGEKAKETVGLDPKDGRDPKDIGYNNNSSTYNQSAPTASSGSGATGYGNTNNQSSTGTGYNQGSSSSYGTGTGTSSEYGTETHRKKGFGEKVKEAVGLDPKDPAKDPKDGGFNTRA